MFRLPGTSLKNPKIYRPTSKSQPSSIPVQRNVFSIVSARWLFNDLDSRRFRLVLRADRTPFRAVYFYPRTLISERRNFIKRIFRKFVDEKSAVILKSLAPPEPGEFINYSQYLRDGFSQGSKASKEPGFEQTMRKINILATIIVINIRNCRLSTWPVMPLMCLVAFAYYTCTRVKPYEIAL